MTVHTNIKNLTSCNATAQVLHKENVECESECPFPFCVTADASRVSRELRPRLIAARHLLGETVDQLAKSLNTSARSIYRILEGEEAGACVNTECELCTQVQNGVLKCKSNLYTVVNTSYNNGIEIILNKHRRANLIESVAVNDLIEYAFPYSNLTRGSGIHDMWAVDRIPLEEAKKFELMCGAFNAFVLKASIKEAVLQ